MLDKSNDILIDALNQTIVSLKRRISSNETRQLALERRLYCMRSILEAGQVLSRESDLGALLDRAVAMCAQFAGDAPSGVLLWNPERGSFEWAAGFGVELYGRRMFRCTDDRLWNRLRCGEAIEVRDSTGRACYLGELEPDGCQGFEARLWLPIVTRDEILGVVLLGERRDGFGYGPQDHEDLMLLGSLMTFSLDAALARRPRTRRIQRSDDSETLKVVRELQHAVASSLDVESVMSLFLKRSIDAIGAEKGSLMLWDEEDSALSVRMVQGLPDVEIERQINAGELDCRQIKPGEGIAGRVYATNEPISLDGEALSESFEGNPAHTDSLLCVPLRMAETAMGVINISNKIGGFSSRDVELMMALAGQAALAIDRSRLYEMATTDGLTGVLVRRHFGQRFSDEIRRAKRFKRTLSVVLLDIDHFKIINDTCGHLVGDEILRSLGAILNDNLREEIDVVGRYGGDEFGLVLPETGMEGARVVAARISRLISALTFGPEGRRVTLSVGVTAWPMGGETMESLLESADKALYRAKAQGRGCVVLDEAGRDAQASMGLS